jgi:hypothetical protein
LKINEPAKNQTQEVIKMPGKDGTGPKGKGPLTGFGSGKCAVPLNTKKEELTFLKNQRDVLRKELENVKRRIASLEAIDVNKNI